tara:strand:+ start:186 stop:482 length:297 start_codon:yes stop_codon:yes gene_type:complete
MSYEEVELLSEIYAKIKEIEELIEERGYTDRIMSAMVVGLMDEVETPESDSVEMKSLFSYNLQSDSELDIIIDLMRESYDGGNDDLRNMLNDLGISLN